MDNRFVRESEKGCLLCLKVIPRSSRNQVVGIEQGELKIKLQAPPVEGAANDAVLGFLSEWFKRPKNSFTLASGHQSRHKKVNVSGMKAQEVWEAVHQATKGKRDA